MFFIRGNRRSFLFVLIIELQQKRNCCLPVGSVDIESVGIVAFSGFGNCAEDSLEFSPCDDSYVIVLIFLEVAASVFLDCSGCRSRLCVCGKIPVPFSGRVGCHKDIISVASVNDVPIELYIFAAGHFSTDISGPGSDKDHIGPWTVCAAPDGADGENIDMSVIQAV